ncbi:MAG: BppU family phage baseplate upper protein [Eubacterium sp.]|nr:BppU family phage baseplate upper protein [Eubacterium sp.]
MNKITQQLSLDLVEISHNVINARQNDQLTRDINITITNNGQEYELPETAFAYLRGKRADTKPVFYSVEIVDRKKGLLHAELHNYVLSCSGGCTLDIGIYNRIQDENKTPNEENEIASTDSFMLYIPEEVLDEVEIVESDEGSTLAQLINSARDEIEEMNSLEETVTNNEKQRTTNESVRESNEENRQKQENQRQEDSETVIKNANDAIQSANLATDNANSAAESADSAAANANAKATDLQNKLDSHHFVLTEDKDVAGGVPGLDTNTKIRNNKLYQATTTSKGITQLTDSVASNSVSTAATANSVKTAYDKAVSVGEDLKSHNSSINCHNDIRNLISALTTRLNALADSDDTTLDQLSEIVAYIKNNKNLIDGITRKMDSLEETVTNNEKQRTINESVRESNEENRQKQENQRQEDTKTAIRNTNAAIQSANRATDNANSAAESANNAATNANDKATDLQNKLDSHHFVLTEDRDKAGGVPGLDTNTKIPSDKLYQATTTSKGITQLTNSVTSNSVSTAATANSVKTAYDKAVSVDGDLKSHNSSDNCHNDIRNLISVLTSRLNALADSDDTTLDQLSEIVAYIKNNKNLIDGITTSKVNVSDIIDNLLSTAVNKPLSAKQGKILKDLIDGKSSASHTHSYLPLSGGVITKTYANYGDHHLQIRNSTYPNAGVDLFVDKEGGNIELKTNDSSIKYEIDTNENGLRLYQNHNGAIATFLNILNNKMNLMNASFSGSVAFPDNSWINIGNDIVIGDRNHAGALVLKGLNGDTGLVFMKKGNESITGSLQFNGTDFKFSDHNICAKNLRLKPSGANYGSKLNFGDGEYVYFHEDSDDHLLLHAKNGFKINSNVTIAANSMIQFGDYNTERIQANNRILELRGYSGISLPSYIRSDICPTTANEFKLGTSYYRWKEIWCSTSLNTTSDRNLKKNINNLSADDRYCKFFMLLQPKSYLFKDGESGRTHIGFISQDVEEAMSTCGLSSLEFAGFCKDQKIERIENEEGIIEENPVFDDEGNPVYIYSLRYEEFIALNTMMIQKLHEENMNLDKRLSILEEKISHI